MKLFDFNQNNSGGSFHINDDVTYHVYVEAETAKQANKWAKNNTPIYFNGCSKGNDCSCCGDRWYKVSDYNGEEYDSKEAALEHFKTKKAGMFDVESIIYFKDGTKEKIVYGE